MLQVCKFETKRVDWIFSIYLILPAALGPGVYKASNRNQYQKQKKCFGGVERGRCVRLTTLSQFINWLSRHCRILDISQLYRPLRHVKGITLLTRWKGVVSFTLRQLYPQERNLRYTMCRRISVTSSKTGLINISTCETFDAVFALANWGLAWTRINIWSCTGSTVVEVAIKQFDG
jgi:hypothetical protein